MFGPRIEVKDDNRIYYIAPLEDIPIGWQTLEEANSDDK
jgi:hypothetical protein